MVTYRIILGDDVKSDIVLNLTLIRGEHWTLLIQHIYSSGNSWNSSVVILNESLWSRGETTHRNSILNAILSLGGILSVSYIDVILNIDSRFHATQRHPRFFDRARRLINIWLKTEEFSVRLARYHQRLDIIFVVVILGPHLLNLLIRTIKVEPNRILMIQNTWFLHLSLFPIIFIFILWQGFTRVLSRWWRHLLLLLQHHSLDDLVFLIQVSVPAFNTKHGVKDLLMLVPHDLNICW